MRKATQPWAALLGVEGRAATLYRLRTTRQALVMPALRVFRPQQLERPEVALAFRAGR